MKKLLLIFAAFTLFTAFFASCNNERCKECPRSQWGPQPGPKGENDCCEDADY